MLTRDKLEYQMRLRFIREGKEAAKTASPELKLAKVKEEDALSKPMVTLGDKENRVPARGETPKEYNETPKTGEESLVKEPVEAGDRKAKKLDFDLDLMDVVQLKEAKGWYVFKVSDGPNDEPYDGLGLEMLDIEPQYYTDKAEAEVVADMLIDVEDSDFDVARVGSMMMEATPPQKDADQSLARHKKRKKATRTKSMKRKSHAKIKESNLAAVLRECGCEMQSPFDAPEDEPQGYMLVQNLEKLAKKAGELTGVAKYTDDAEPWVESKVNSAAEHIDAIYDYIKYGRNKKSDMNGQEDLHPPHHHDEMMQEQKKNSILSEQTSDIYDPWTGQPVSTPSTDIVNPFADNTPQNTVTPAAAPARRRRRGPVRDVTQAINLIIDPNTQRSFINHLTRMLRGISTSNASIADYELRANRTSVAFVLNRYIPLIRRERTDLAAVLNELVNQINTFNSPALPNTLAEITNKRAVVQKINALISWINSNRNRLTVTAPTTTTAPDRDGTTPPTPEQQAASQEANQLSSELSRNQQEIGAYIHSVMSGEVDLNNAANRPRYIERLNQLAGGRNDIMRRMYMSGARTNRDQALAAINRRISQIDARINQLGSDPASVTQTFSESVSNHGNVENLLNFLFEQDSSLWEATKTFIITALGARFGPVIINSIRARHGAQAFSVLTRLANALRNIAPRILELIRNLATTNPTAAQTVLAQEVAVADAGIVDAVLVNGVWSVPGVAATGAAETAALGAGEAAALGAGEALATTGAVAGAETAVGAAGLGVMPWLIGAAGAGAGGYGLGTLLGQSATYLAGEATGRGTESTGWGRYIGRGEENYSPENLRYASRAAQRLLQNEKSALEAIRDEIATGRGASFSGIINPYGSGAYSSSQRDEDSRFAAI